MKNAKFIKNELYKTLYRASDDTYQYAVISFTSVRYDDKEREEFVTFNRMENGTSDEAWKEKLSKRISNYDDFINNNETWKEEGTYKELTDKVKFIEPESLDEKEFALDSIEQIEITQVKNKDVDLAFVDIYDQNGSKYNMTCDYENKDIILCKLVLNYEKLCKKGKVNIINKQETVNDTASKVSEITFIVNNDKVDVYLIYIDRYGKPYLHKTDIERAFQRIEEDDSINVRYKKIVDGRAVDITEEEFEEYISNSYLSNDEIAEAGYVSTHNSHINYYGYEKAKNSKNKKIAIFAAAVVLAGGSLCALLLKRGHGTNNVPLRKSSSTSKTDSSNSTATTLTTNDATATISYSGTETTTNNGNITVTMPTSDNSDTNTNTTIFTSADTNVNTTTTNNGYVTTTKPATSYNTNTYRTINTSDMVTSGTNKTTTKTTTKNIVPSGTVNPRDMVTAGPKPGDQVFTKDGATTTTKKATTTTKSTTSYNPYADLIITHEINAAAPETNKSLVLKK